MLRSICIIKGRTEALQSLLQTGRKFLVAGRTGHGQVRKDPLRVPRARVRSQVTLSCWKCAVVTKDTCGMYGQHAYGTPTGSMTIYDLLWGYRIRDPDT